MANSDYSVTATSAPFCPNAQIVNAVGPLTTVFDIENLRSTGVDEILAGEAAMINDEIVKVVSISSTELVVARGCADTIPQAHAAGSRIWFFNDSIGYDGREYAGSETVGVKILPKTASSQVPIEYSPPSALTFNFRFARPYAPGLVEVNGDPFTEVKTINPTNDTLSLTWAHRDRVTQFDQLIDHLATSIGPEAGTTYTVKAHRSSDNSVVRTTTGITGASWTYPLATARSDFGITVGAVGAPVVLTDGYLTLEAVRDGYTSWQKYRIDFKVSNAAV